MPESIGILEHGSKTIGAQGLNPSQLLALIYPLDQCVGFELLQIHHLRPPWILEYNVIILAVQLEPWKFPGEQPVLKLAKKKRLNSIPCKLLEIVLSV